jgi:hypothetical protein
MLISQRQKALISSDNNSFDGSQAATMMIVAKQPRRENLNHTVMHLQQLKHQEQIQN